MNPATFLVTMKSRPYHGLLLAAARKAGGYGPLASALGWSTRSVAFWVTLRDYPRLLFAPAAGIHRGNYADARVRRSNLDKALDRVVAPGLTTDECWPAELRELIDRTRSLRSLVYEETRPVPLRRLSGSMARRLLASDTSSPIAAASIEELRRDLDDALTHHLKKREADALRARFGLDGTPPAGLTELGQLLGVSRERARQIEQTALLRLSRRCPGLVFHLPHVDGN